MLQLSNPTCSSKRIPQHQLPSQPTAKRVSSCHRERLLQARRLRREQLRTTLGDHHVILEPDAELPGDVDARLVRKHHAWLERKGVALHEIGPFVAVHAHAMTHAMAE